MHGHCKLMPKTYCRELAECKFEAYPVSTWGQGTFASGTSMFSFQSQASQSQGMSGASQVSRLTVHLFVFCCFWFHIIHVSIPYGACLL